MSTGQATAAELSAGLSGRDPARSPAGRAASLALLLAVIGAVGSVVALFANRPALLRAWLAGFTFLIGLPLGSLALLMAHDLTGGRWGAAAAPALRRAAATLPLVAVAVLPILLWPRGLYPWADPQIAATLPNSGYLNTGFFIARSVGSLVIWSLLALAYLRRTGEGEEGASRQAPALAAFGLILLFLTSTVTTFDWLMSLEPRWKSSIFGMLVTAGDLLAAMATAAAVTAVAQLDRQPAQQVREALADLGSILVAGAILWVYLQAMQYIIIWEENLPREIVWYLPRGQGRWAVAAVLMLAAQFLIPFLVLVWKPLKSQPVVLAIVSAIVVAGHLVETSWLVLPEFPGGTGWVTPFPALLLGGLWFAILLARAEPLHADRAMAKGGRP